MVRYGGPRGLHLPAREQDLSCTTKRGASRVPGSDAPGAIADRPAGSVQRLSAASDSQHDRAQRAHDGHDQPPSVSHQLTPPCTPRAEYSDLVMMLSPDDSPRWGTPPVWSDGVKGKGGCAAKEARTGSGRVDRTLAREEQGSISRCPARCACAVILASCGV